MYKPLMPFSIKARLQTFTYSKVNGVSKKVYTDSIYFFCSVRTFGGTEKVINDKYVIEDTAVIDTLFNPSIVSGCRIILLDDNSEWDILSTPENIERRNQFLTFKVKRVKGGA